MAVIGFLNTVLNISEDGGALDFNIGVIDGDLRINVTVDFTTNDGNAHGMSRGYYSYYSHLFHCFTFYPQLGKTIVKLPLLLPFLTSYSCLFLLVSLMMICLKLERTFLDFLAAVVNCHPTSSWHLRKQLLLFMITTVCERHHRDSHRILNDCHIIMHSMYTRPLYTSFSKCCTPHMCYPFPYCSAGNIYSSLGTILTHGTYKQASFYCSYHHWI